MTIPTPFWRLEDAKTGQPVTLPLRRADFRGEPNWTVRGGRPPAEPGKAGHVWVTDEDDREREFYPSVYGLAWRLRPELATAARMMIARGGSFAGHLGQAYLAADTDNTWRLLAAFSDLFGRYLEEVQDAAAGQ
jgi:hypothetical protein